MTIIIDKNTRLELIAENHANGLFNAINNSREHLSKFLPWVDNMATIEDTQNYIEHCLHRYYKVEEISFVIIMDENIVGRIGLHHIDINNKHAEIGYWLTEKAQGRGVVSKSCKTIITYGFKELDLHRIEIKAAAENLKSQAIPLKFSFKQEGILRQAELVNNQFLDLVLFSMLKSEWNDAAFKISG